MKEQEKIRKDKNDIGASNSVKQKYISDYNKMTQKQKQRKKNFAFPQHLFQKVNLKVNWRLVNRSFGAVIVVMVVAYIVSVNDLAIQSFTLSQTKNKISEIQKESERLNLVAMDLGSYESISRRAAAMKMVKVDKIDYIEIKASAVAKK